MAKSTKNVVSVKTRILGYVPAAGNDATGNLRIVDRSSVLSAVNAVNACKAWSRKGKEPRRIGADGAFADYPAMIAGALEDAGSVLIACYVGIATNRPEYAWAQRETVRVGDCNLSLRVALAAFLGEPCGLSAAQIRKAFGSSVVGK
jgi:hypothetical protein